MGGCLHVWAWCGPWRLPCLLLACAAPAVGSEWDFHDAGSGAVAMCEAACCVCCWVLRHLESHLREREKLLVKADKRYQELSRWVGGRRWGWEDALGGCCVAHSTELEYPVQGRWRHQVVAVSHTLAQGSADLQRLCSRACDHNSLLRATTGTDGHLSKVTQCLCCNGGDRKQVPSATPSLVTSVCNSCSCDGFSCLALACGGAGVLPGAWPSPLRPSQQGARQRTRPGAGQEPTLPRCRPSSCSCR